MPYVDGVYIPPPDLLERIRIFLAKVTAKKLAASQEFPVEWQAGSDEIIIRVDEVPGGRHIHSIDIKEFLPALEAQIGPSGRPKLSDFYALDPDGSKGWRAIFDSIVAQL